MPKTMEPFRENNREKQVKFIGVPEIDKESRLRNRKRKPRVVMMEEIAERNVPDFLVYQALARLTLDEFAAKCNNRAFQGNSRMVLLEIGVEGVQGMTVNELFDALTRTHPDQLPSAFAFIFQPFLPVTLYFDSTSPKSALTNETFARSSVETIVDLNIVNNDRLFKETLFVALTAAKSAAANSGIEDPEQVKPMFNERFVQPSALFCDVFANLHDMSDPDSSMDLSGVNTTMREAIADYLQESPAGEGVKNAITDHIVNQDYE